MSTNAQSQKLYERLKKANLASAKASADPALKAVPSAEEDKTAISKVLSNPEDGGIGRVTAQGGR